MIPVSDGVAARRFPIVNVALIAANFTVFLFYELPNPAVVTQAAFYPCDVTSACHMGGLPWAHVREVIDQHAKPDCGDDGGLSCGCGATRPSDHSSHVALAIVNRIRKTDWRVSIASPSPRVRSMNGVVIESHVSLDEASGAMRSSWAAAGGLAKWSPIRR
jgi:hypothetical protein